MAKAKNKIVMMKGERTFHYIALVVMISLMIFEGSSVFSVLSPYVISPLMQVISSFGSKPKKVYLPHRSLAQADSSIYACVEAFFRMRIVSMGVVKSERISQLTGTTSYLPVAANALTSSIDGTTFILVTSGSSLLPEAKKTPSDKRPSDLLVKDE